MKVKGRLEDPFLSLYHVGFRIKLRLVANVFMGSQNYLLRHLPVNTWHVIKIISLLYIFHWDHKVLLGVRIKPIGVCNNVFIKTKQKPLRESRRFQAPIVLISFPR